MRRIVSLLAVPAVAFGATLFAGGPASALGGESLVCTIAPSAQTTPRGFCFTSRVSSTYGIGYSLQNLSGSYTIAWTPPPSAQITFGCTAGSMYCDVEVPATQGDRSLVATVVLTQGGAQETLSAEADIPAVCGQFLC